MIIAFVNCMQWNLKHADIFIAWLISSVQMNSDCQSICTEVGSLKKI